MGIRDRGRRIWGAVLHQGSPQGKTASWAWGGVNQKAPQGVDNRLDLWGPEGQQGEWDPPSLWLCDTWQSTRPVPRRGPLGGGLCHGPATHPVTPLLQGSQRMQLEGMFGPSGQVLPGRMSRTRPDTPCRHTYVMAKCHAKKASASPGSDLTISGKISSSNNSSHHFRVLRKE